VDVDRGQLVGRRLEDITVVMRLHELAPVGGRPAGRRDWWWLERRSKLHRHLTGSPFHQQIATRPAESPNTAATKPSTLFSDGHNLAAVTMSPRYAASTSHPCHAHGKPQPQPYRFAGNQ